MKIRWISSNRRRAVAATAMLVVIAALVAAVGWAAFSGTTGNTGNSFSAGTVTLSDDDAGAVMFTVSGMRPGDSVVRCINVTYGGSLSADVKLYGAVGGSGLASYLTTTIEAGSGAVGGLSFDCTGFGAAETLHSGTLAAFGTANTNYATGLGGFAGATAGSTRSYRVTVTLQDDNAAQGLSATATLTWEAQNA